jgi:magnesium chelatase accessory protein
MSDQLVWERDGGDWPNRHASRFVQAAGLRWHVQVMGTGPVLLLIHGTGAATHSWRDLAPLLARRFTVVAPDLPGHGFTETPAPHHLSLPHMASDLTALLRTLRLTPAIAAGHSAGAAILAQMSLEGNIAPVHLVSLNGAMLPLPGLPGKLFSPIARLLVASNLAPRLFAWRSRDPAVVRRLIRGTGSTLDATGIALYGRVIRSRRHAAAALGMMANWELGDLQRALPRLKPLLTLVVGDNDRTISPAEGRRVLAFLPSARLVTLRGLGHLAHEERPDEVADVIARLAVARPELEPA